MSPRRDPLFALQDVEKSAEAVAEYTAGLDEAAFLADRIDHVTVWDTAVHDLPELRRTIESLISELDSASAPTSAAPDIGEK